MRHKKKLYKKQIKVLDKEITEIVKNPEIGPEKKGTLKGVRVHKFNIQKQLYLIAYEPGKDILNLIMIGRHENYYKNLDKYHKE